MRFTLLALTLLSCSQPGTNDANAYIEQLGPLLHENRLLADQVLLLAADLHNTNHSPEHALSGWQNTVVPLASHLAHQSAALSTPTEWTAEHAKLSAIWDTRAIAYSDLSRSIAIGDRSLWDSARKNAGDVKLQEEEWFRHTNERLAPMRLSVANYR